MKDDNSERQSQLVIKSAKCLLKIKQTDGFIAAAEVVKKKSLFVCLADYDINSPNTYECGQS